MQAILYVGHGSRVQEGNEQLRAFVSKIQARFPQIPIQETAFIELEQPTIQEGIEACRKQGATHIAVIPILLLSAGHAKIDIPNEIKSAMEKHPTLIFTYSQPIGVEKIVIDILKERLLSVGVEHITGRPDSESRENKAVLLIGRGSSDPDANSDLMKISRLLWEYTPIKRVEVSYLAATEPTVDEGLERLLKEPVEEIIMLPYLLFTGVLMKSLEKKLNQVQKTTEKKLSLGMYLGFDDKLVDIVSLRVRQGLKGESEWLTLSR
ncbi:hypothetical protein AJ85_20160 [Alkalihalobacillus alcalophilus ATCC 27647 = CGMCC 1.3604]|uniref:Sirohydrochlorin ferrochelatase n=1 Tax=Alkalihalobacillus alcalophilus ATCC 27647 = CGMCC 1.3604 TaxID=1218173 RepID=A0A4S4JZA9_ALKAL|nr:sirohydrochlorin chelatase [Alkalihalobacillus alcalophilus]MED1563055.1 sirohydrochlorin chelatase [Alkalihalobacillus alcalophilus]THG88989.1 hypothetical protein AJ85_20160 [Alkalihalobacillus alcalophilus ATCC 27647 = CGMCC 1.3604]